MSIRIRLDRDSVAMGDDVESHELAVELPDDATPADLLARAIDTRFLASVAGDVAWLLRVRGIVSAAIIVEYSPLSSGPRVLPLSRTFWQPISRWGNVTPEGEDYAADFAYVPNAELLAWREFEVTRARTT